MNYLFGFLGTLVLAAASWGLSFIFNPVTMLFVACAAPFISLLGMIPADRSWSAMGTYMWVSIFWPLTLTPLHYLNYQVLKWNHWAFGGLFVGTGLLIAFIVLLNTSTRVS